MNSASCALLQECPSYWPHGPLPEATGRFSKNLRFPFSHWDCDSQLPLWGIALTTYLLFGSHFFRETKVGHGISSQQTRHKAHSAHSSSGETGALWPGRRLQKGVPLLFSSQCPMWGKLSFVLRNFLDFKTYFWSRIDLTVGRRTQRRQNQLRWNLPESNDVVSLLILLNTFLRIDI